MKTHDELLAEFTPEVLRATKVFQDAITEDNMDIGLAEMAMLSSAACLCALRCKSRAEIKKEADKMAQIFLAHTLGYFGLGTENGMIGEVQGSA